MAVDPFRGVRDDVTMKKTLILLLLLGSCTGPGGADHDAEARQSFTMQAIWTPIASSTYDVHEDPRWSATLAPEPVEPEASYTWADVTALLPLAEIKGPKDHHAVWDVDPQALLRFLRQLHPSATDLMHHHLAPDLPDPATLPPGVSLDSFPKPGTVLPGRPVGAKATLLRDGRHQEILLRLHAEFVLMPDQVWFTPGQFEGRLSVDRELEQVLAFHLEVPARDTNYDINVRNTPDPMSGGAADIGFVPDVSVRTEAAPTEFADEELNRGRQRLARAFYPFAEIDWLPLAEAWAEAQRNGKPLHVVQLFGTLDDESC